MSLAFHVPARRGDFVLAARLETTARAVAVVSPSGAGKTTLLLGLAGLIPVEAARLAPPPHRRGVGYVFQDGRLFPHLNVGANVGFARPYAPEPLEVAAALALVGLEGFETRWPLSLSGGESRRVAVARALVARPRLLLLDQPFAGLDSDRRAALIPYFIRLRDTLETPMIIVSHDDRDLAELAQDVLPIANGHRV